jgi:2-methylaconitate cis-trans-isomerase PrpF
MRCGFQAIGLNWRSDCGNIASGVGPFAVGEGLVDVSPRQKQVKVRVLNTNTNIVMIETVRVDGEGYFLGDRGCRLAGLCSVSSRGQMGFFKPAGAMTGKLPPSERAMNTILMQPHSTPNLSRYNSVLLLLPTLSVLLTAPHCRTFGTKGDLEQQSLSKSLRRSDVRAS